MNKKQCDDDKILNPITNRCVKRDGVIGKKFLAAMQLKPETPKQESPKPETPKSVKSQSPKHETPLIKLSNKEITMKCLRKGLKQITGTCFFNSALNGFILSQNGSKHFKQVYDDLSNDEKKELIDIDLNTCPLNLKKMYVLKYMSQFFNEIEPLFSYNKQNHAELLIEKLLTPGNKILQMYPIESMTKILSSCFDKSEYSIYNKTEVIMNMPKLTDKFCIYYYDKNILMPIPAIPEKVGKLSLDNCCIYMNFSKGDPHVISGYKCNKKEYIYDSNMNHAVQVTWSKLVTKWSLKKALEKYASKFYKERLISAGFMYICYA